ncbi:carboxypeptidase-like regulatory domain-containing protein [Polaribacter gangjinensis]|nr:carboxypeptidase-like regulatory domain-containing protein [Polaribacter gangjinensis]
MENKFLFFFFIFTINFFSQHSNITLNGVIIDSNKNTVPYAAIGILSKAMGTSSNDDGEFFLKLTRENLSDTLTVSSIGYKTFKIKVQDFINQTEKIIVLEEEVVSLGEITLIKPDYYVKKALKNIKNTTLSSLHQLTILYRRFSTENNTPRFLVEHYMHVLDRSLTINEFQEASVLEIRKSVDYRYVKFKQNFHAAEMIAKQNPLRGDFYANDYNWKVTGDSSYDGEEIIIVQGNEKVKPGNWVRLYIGVVTFGIYKLEKSHNNATYIYKKDKEGKLYLSYHNREFKSKEPITPHLKNLLKLKSNTIDLSYRHEAIVLGVEKDWKNINIKSNIKGNQLDMGDYNLPYNEMFWNHLSMPPDSKFYIKNKKELESIFGVPLNIQYKAVNSSKN